MALCRGGLMPAQWRRSTSGALCRGGLMPAQRRRSTSVALCRGGLMPAQRRRSTSAVLRRSVCVVPGVVNQRVARLRLVSRRLGASCSTCHRAFVGVSVCGVSGVAHLCVGAPCVGMRGIRTGTGQVLSGLVQVAQTSGRQHPWLILARQWDETPSKLAFGQLSKTLVSWMAQRLARQVQRRRLSPADAEALAKCANRLHAGVVSVLAQRATLRWSPEHREQLIIEPRVVERNTASCLAHALGTAVPERLSWNGLMTLAAYVGMIVLILQKDLLNKQAVLTETHHQHVNRDG